MPIKLTLLSLCLAVLHAGPANAEGVLRLFSSPVELESGLVQSKNVEVSRLPAEGISILRVEMLNGEHIDFRVQQRTKNASGSVTTVAKNLGKKQMPALVLTQKGGATYGIFPDATGVLQEVRTEGSRTYVRKLPHWTEEIQPTDVPDFVAIPPVPNSDPQGLGVEANRSKGNSVATVDVLAIYTQDVVDLTGSESNAITYFESLFAIANTAFSDSGGLVQIRPAHFVKSMHAGTVSNSETYRRLADNNLTDGLDVASLREQHSADLVTLFRDGAPFRENGGVGDLLGADFGSGSLDKNRGFSVIGFGGFVLAHEIGHAFGAHHDVETETSDDGSVSRGAYRFSHGLRRDYDPSFFTIMAYYLPGQTQSNQAPYFSHPDTKLCFGSPCGFDGETDNARTISQIAPMVAAFRVPVGTLAVAPVDVREPAQDWDISVEIRLGERAQTAVTFKVSTTDRSASAGRDYLPLNNVPVTIAAGQDSGIVNVRILSDAEVEEDETFELHISDPSDSALATISGLVTIRDDDPRVSVQGRIELQDALYLPSEMLMHVYGVDGSQRPHLELRLYPPNYEFQFDAIESGGVLEFYPFVSSLTGVVQEWYRVPVDGRDLSQLVFTMGPPRKLSGRVVAMSPEVQLPSTVSVEVYGVGADHWRVFYRAEASAPSFEYEVDLLRNRAFRVAVAGDIAPAISPNILIGPDHPAGNLDLRLLSVPDIVPIASNSNEGSSPTINRRLYVRNAFSGIPTQSGSFRIRTLDTGSATANVDFVPIDQPIQFTAGFQFMLIDIPIEVIGDQLDEGDETVEIELYDAVNVRLATSRVTLTIKDDDRDPNRVFASGFERTQ